MAKDKTRKAKKPKASRNDAKTDDKTDDKADNGRMKRSDYEKELQKLQVELCHLQEWVKQKGLRVIVAFEGRDAAGKGGTIKALTERVSPRVFRVIAMPAPSDRQKTQMFMQRYIEQFPARDRDLRPQLV
jgi:polyphosphate kinase 2 (PPK2 family)